MADDTFGPGVTQMTERAPEPPPTGPWRWIRENLFSGHTWEQIAFNVFLTLAFALVLVNLLQFITTYLFSPDRRWSAVTHNMKLLMVQAFPQDDLGRIWISVGILTVLVVWSLVSWKVGGRIPLPTLATGLRGLGALAAVAVLMHHGAAARTVGIPLLKLDLPIDWSPSRTWLFVGVLVLAVLAHFTARTARKADREGSVPLLAIPVAVMIALTAALWTVKLPVPLGQFEETAAPIATTTARSWTILFAVTVVAYVLGGQIEWRSPTRFRRFLISAWILSYPVIVFVIQRNPILDWPDMLGFGTTPFLRSDLGTVLIFGLLLGAAVWVLALPTKRAATGSTLAVLGVATAALPVGFGGGPLWSGAAMAAVGLAMVLGALMIRDQAEMVRAAGAGLTVVSLLVWFTPMPFLYRFLIIAIALVVLMTPTFGEPNRAGPNSCAPGGWLRCSWWWPSGWVPPTPPSSSRAPPSWAGST